MAQVAPRVLNRFQNRFITSAGRLPEAATAKASATRNAMFRSWAKIDSTMATPPIANAAIRATLTSSFSDAVPFLITLA